VVVGGIVVVVVVVGVVAAVVVTGAFVAVGTTQLPSQHRDESDDLTIVPSQTCPDGQTVPP